MLLVELLLWKKSVRRKIESSRDEKSLVLIMDVSGLDKPGLAAAQKITG